MLCLALDLCALFMTSFPSGRVIDSGMGKITSLRTYLQPKVKKTVTQIATNVVLGPKINEVVWD